MKSEPRLLDQLKQQLAALPLEERLPKLFALFDGLDDVTLGQLLYDWQGLWARPNQLEPAGDWIYWLILAGRGYGKTRTGAETYRKWCKEMPGARGFIAARTIADARDTCVEGESGLLACLPPNERPPFGGEWNRSKGELWLGATRDTSTYTKLFSSEEPDSARGPQFHFGWGDELAAWLKAAALWDQLQFGLRLPWPGRNARAVVTTTPKPVKVVRDMLKHRRTVVTRGTTYENLSNLSPAFQAIIAKYEGTRLGRQELKGELLEDTPGALWTRALIELHRVEMPPLALNARGEEAFDFTRIVVAIDPSTTADGDEAGVTAGGRGANGHKYLLDDVSRQGKPSEWAEAAVELFHRLKADRIVAESNNGGEMVADVIRAVDKDVPVQLVWASRGKRTRAEPIAAQYEQGRCHHVGTFELLEDELCTWTPEALKSPNRLDSLVWNFTGLEGAALYLG